MSSDAVFFTLNLTKFFGHKKAKTYPYRWIFQYDPVVYVSDKFRRLGSLGSLSS